MLVFEASCEPCERNWPYWTRVLQEAAASRYRVVPIDLTASASAAYLRGHALNPSGVLTHLTPASVLAYGLGYTPQTLLVNDGRVLGVWTGVLNESRVAEIQRELKRTSTITRP